MRLASCMLLVLLAIAGASQAQEAPDKNPPPPTPQTPVSPPQPGAGGPGIEGQVSVGEKAPDFELDGSQGGRVRLADLKGSWAMLIFDQSRTRFAPLKEIDGALRKLGVRPYGVCLDGIGPLKTYAEREKLPFLLLSDSTGEISQLYGMYDDDTGAIQPGLVLLDPQGLIRMVLLGQSLHQDEVLQLAKHVVIGG